MSGCNDRADASYANGKLLCGNVESTRKVITQLLEQYRKDNAPVIHICHKTPEGAPLFTPNTQLSEIFDELKPKEGEPVVWKQAPGAFTGTELDAEIKKTGKSQVVVTGYQAHGCVNMTSRQAAELGYDTICIRDAIGDRDIPGATWQESLKTTLAGFEDMWGSVIDAKDVQ